MAEANNEARSRDRSPSYPIIPLDAAIKRLVEFEAHFKRTPARPEKVGDAWGIKAAAYAGRTSAALRYFGLLDYVKGESGRMVVISEDGRTYLRAQQESLKRDVIKRAALRPKQIAYFWSVWGTDRPADAACIDVLTMGHSFSDAGAREFLKVYDSTISFAQLTGSDKDLSPDIIDDDDDDGQETEGSDGGGSVTPSSESARGSFKQKPPAKPAPLRVSIDGDQLEVSAVLEDADSVDRLIDILKANKALLPPKKGSEPDAG